MDDSVLLKINGNTVTVERGCTVAAAVMRTGTTTFRRSVMGESRTPLCGMGICFECRVTINGQAHSRSCQILCQDGMEISTDE